MGFLRLREAREIGENYAIFHNRISAKRREQTKIGQEPGLKDMGSGRFKPPPLSILYDLLKPLENQNMFKKPGSAHRSEIDFTLAFDLNRGKNNTLVLLFTVFSHLRAKGNICCDSKSSGRIRFSNKRSLLSFWIISRLSLP